MDFKLNKKYFAWTQKASRFAGVGKRSLSNMEGGSSKRLTLSFAQLTLCTMQNFWRNCMLAKGAISMLVRAGKGNNLADFAVDQFYGGYYFGRLFYHFRTGRIAPAPSSEIFASHVRSFSTVKSRPRIIGILHEKQWARWIRRKLTLTKQRARNGRDAPSSARATVEKKSLKIQNQKIKSNQIIQTNLDWEIRKLRSVAEYFFTRHADARSLGITYSQPMTQEMVPSQRKIAPTIAQRPFDPRLGPEFADLWDHPKLFRQVFAITVPNGMFFCFLQKQYRVTYKKGQNGFWSAMHH